MRYVIEGVIIPLVDSVKFPTNDYVVYTDPLWNCVDSVIGEVARTNNTNTVYKNFFIHSFIQDNHDDAVYQQLNDCFKQYQDIKFYKITLPEDQAFCLYSKMYFQDGSHPCYGWSTAGKRQWFKTNIYDKIMHIFDIMDVFQDIPDKLKYQLLQSNKISGQEVLTYGG